MRVCARVCVHSLGMRTRSPAVRVCLARLFLRVQVSVVESHSVAGGAAHTWHRGPYHFESGPSLYSGMNGERDSFLPAGCSHTAQLCFQLPAHLRPSRTAAAAH